MMVQTEPGTGTEYKRRHHGMTAVLKDTVRFEAECEARDLRRAVSLVNRVFPTRSVDAVEISGGGGLWLTGAYGGTELSVRLPGTVTERFGRLGVYCRALRAAVDALPAGTVRLEARDGVLCLTVGTASVQVPLMAPPQTMERGELIAGCHFGAEDLRAALDSVAFASYRKDNERWPLQGVHIALTESGITFAATDTHRLAVRRFPDGADHRASVILPNAGAKLARAMVADAEGPAELMVRQRDGRRALEIAGDNFTLTGQGIAGVYPDYESIIPERYGERLVLDREAFAAAVKAVAPAAADINRVMLRTDGGKLWITAAGEKGAQAQASVPCGGDMAEAVAFNCKYLLEGLKACGGEMVSFGINGPASVACLWPGDGEAPGDYLYLIMPMRPA
jgi:DNA polymerase-3 subunit beta